MTQVLSERIKEIRATHRISAPDPLSVKEARFAWMEATDPLEKRRARRTLLCCRYRALAARLSIYRALVAMCEREQGAIREEISPATLRRLQRDMERETLARQLGGRGSGSGRVGTRPRADVVNSRARTTTQRVVK